MRKGNPQLFFGTSNLNKFNEAKRILEPYEINLGLLEGKGLEIQSSSLQDIASYAARNLAQKFNLEVIVEDSGLFIRTLREFPGPYSSFVHETIGIEGVLQLMRITHNRSAYFASAVAYCRPDSDPVSFLGTVKGKVSESSKGSRGFGFDPIFVPSEGDGRTFAEMKIEEKNALSHRSRAFKEFAKWYLTLLP